VVAGEHGDVRAGFNGPIAGKVERRDEFPEPDLPLGVDVGDVVKNEVAPEDLEFVPVVLEGLEVRAMIYQ
jgi:hypothetical protein